MLNGWLRGAWMLASLAAAVSPAATAITGEQSADARRAEAERIIAAAVDDGFAGQVLAVVDGDVVLDHGYGLADAEASVPVDTDTVFAIGSVTKAFTRAAVLKLAEQDGLALLDPISKHLDDVPDDKRNVTIDELLTMRAGLQEYHDDTGDHQAMTRDEALRSILAQQLRFEPGTHEAYSNSGYTLLAAIIENVSGQDWDDYIREHLIVPASMERTGFHGDDLWPDVEVARGRGGRTYGDNAPHHWPSPTWALAGAGGMVSDAHDLLRWIRAVRAGEVLGPEALARFYPADEPNRLYAGGDDFGFVTVVMEIDHADDVIIVNTNTGYPAFGLAGDVIEALRGEPLPFAVPGRDRGEIERDTGGGEVRATTGEDVPDSPRGRAAMALVEALQDGSSEALEALVNQHFAAAFRDGFPMAQHLEILGELSREVRSASDINVGPVGELSFELRLVSSGDSDSYIVELEPTPPHGIIGIAPR
ncbi:MAG: serine hydrolase domain-containing protein [Acidobacteriota bacterium]